MAKSVHVRAESVFTFLQNHCSRSPRMGVHVAPEYADQIMNLANGLILLCAIVSFGAIAFVGFALWIRSHDEDADRKEPHGVDLLAMPGVADIDFTPPRLGDELYRSTDLS